MVREFYANLQVNTDGTSNGYLRGIHFEFTADTIAAFYHLPRVRETKFPYVKNDEPSIDDLVCEFSVYEKEGHKHRITHQELRLRAKLIHKIVASTINQTGHITHPTLEDRKSVV